MKTTLYIKNMVCDRCIKVLKNELKDESIKVLDIKLGELTADIQTNKEKKTIRKVVESNGFYIINGENFKLVEQTKLILINLLKNLPLAGNEKLSEILSKEIHHDYFKISKIPNLINTSFNMHEEPIVCNPEDAIKSFLRSKIDYLFIEGFLIKK